MSRTLITVPMKDPDQSKTRLSGTLDDAARARLARLLFRRTLAFLQPIAAQTGAGLAVVTGSQTVTDMARAEKVAVIKEPTGATLSDAVQCAAEWAVWQEYDRLCVIPADLAAPDSAEVLRLLDSRADVTLCPSTDLGTNALLVSPPDALRFCYGPNSAQKHLQAATQAGLCAMLMPLESLSFDIDTSACLSRALASDPELAG